MVQLGDAPLLRSSADPSRARRIEASQAAVRNWVVGRGGQVLASFRRAYNGLWVNISRNQIDALRHLPEVAAVHPVRGGRTCLEGCISFIGADVLRGSTTMGVARAMSTSLAGDAVRIGIIDTGIDYTHQALGGASMFPSAKVIGGYDFAGDTFAPDLNDPRTWTPRPDPDPIDQNGHGSFVAGVAAGVGVPGKLSPGVAPGAKLFAYKVTGPNGEFVTPLVVQAIERAMADGVDVLNLSLGTNFGPPSDPTIAACNNAVAAGIVVVAAAGNFGDVPYSVSSPAVSPGVIAVAASIDAGPGTFRLTSPAELAGNFLAVEGSLSRPLRSTGRRAGSLVYVGRACPGTTFPTEVAGQIALIDRGDCAFREKILAVQAAGAIAVVVVNNVPGAPFLMEGDTADISIPAVMISMEDGGRIREALAAGQVVAGVLEARDEADQLWPETSRGPALTSVSLKPDLAAPGSRIFSVLAGSGDGGFAGSGTSAAAPLVTGVAALLRQLHPDWSVEEIKALLMNTATQTTLDGNRASPLTLQGAGRIRADVAARTQSVALGDPGTGSLSFGFQALEVPVPLIKSLRLRNKSAVARQYVAEAQLLTLSNDPVRATVIPSGPINLEPGAEAELRLVLTFTGVNLDWPAPDGSRDGFVTISETTGSGEVLRVPFHTVLRPASRTLVTLAGIGSQRMMVLTAAGLIPSRADVYAAGVQDPEDAGWENDIRYTGVRSVGQKLDDLRVEFAIAGWHRWTTPDFVTFRIRVDVNEDGQFDATVYNVGTDVYVERLALAPGALRSAFPAQMDPHSGVMSMMVRARDLGLTDRDTRFAYWAESTYGSASTRGSSPPMPLLSLWGGSDQTDKAKFDALRPMFRLPTVANPFQTPQIFSITVSTSQRKTTPSPGLLCVYWHDAPRGQQAVFFPL